MATQGPTPSLFSLQETSSGASGRRPGPGGRAGAGLAFLLAGLSLAWFLTVLARDVEAGAYAVIETDRARMDPGPGWVDPRWESELAWRLAALAPVAADDRDGILRIASEVGALPFVAAVGDTTVIWPDGLRIEVRLRVPVACLRVGRQYLPLAADGTALSGAWSAPPARGSGYLPVVVPSSPFHPRPGELLSDPALTDGLAVAASLWSELAPEDLARLGRTVIDARRSREAAVDQPGTVLLLENARTVWFGRSPNLDEPGEKPVRAKWASLSSALRLLDERPGAGQTTLDWDLADVRWDRPGLHPRGGMGEDPAAEDGWTGM